jgi:hypothetical protein
MAVVLRVLRSSQLLALRFSRGWAGFVVVPGLACVVSFAALQSGHGERLGFATLLFVLSSALVAWRISFGERGVGLRTTTALAPREAVMLPNISVNRDVCKRGFAPLASARYLNR